MPRSRTPSPEIVPPPNSSGTSMEVQPSSAPLSQASRENPTGSPIIRRTSAVVQLEARNLPVVSLKSS